MHLTAIIKADKTAIQVGVWKNGKVPRADFPMARKAYGIGKSYEWCVITFQVLGTECRVLVVMNPPKQKYEAILGVMGPKGDLKILCSYEYHPSEPGWHCHATHDDVAKVPIGCMRGPWVKRVPGAREPHRQNKFPAFKIDRQAEAIRFAYRRYRIEAKGPLL